ncbi:allantoicase [Lingula anatina]|uniref:Allantoate amidinohydrolase n=1 Tax=Lingula anatina TaxID=7574 RepID=A0A2R2MNJ6_LINAN|nr:allantoicase [Lingula anatina]XP_023931798.1 allantoicase [Lingula anatina]|eukprot:XP_023931797.1 allantoicase [Lingula anatina]
MAEIQLIEAPAPHQQPPDYTRLNDLACSKVGGCIVFASDDWFAEAENLLKPNIPEWKEGVFTEYGKWMDGWETRRKRIPGHDWAIIQLGVSGVIFGVDVDTSFFTGNYTPRISIQAANLKKKFPSRNGKPGKAATEAEYKKIAALNSENWETIVPISELKPGYKTSFHNFFRVKRQQLWTHLRLNMFPDGGIARLRVYGQAKRDWSLVDKDTVVDLVAMVNGGVCLGSSNAHFGHPRNLVAPGTGENMGDGWETARRLDRPAVLTADKSGVLQVPGCEWAVFRLGCPGVVKEITLDTRHFKGNFPDSCRIEACNIPLSGEQQALSVMSGPPWKTLLLPQKMTPNREHHYKDEVQTIGTISHIRLFVAPDGGVSRMRIWGLKEDVALASKL